MITIMILMKMILMMVSNDDDLTIMMMITIVIVMMIVIMLGLSDDIDGHCDDDGEGRSGAYDTAQTILNRRDLLF